MSDVNLYCGKTPEKRTRKFPDWKGVLHGRDAENAEKIAEADARSLWWLGARTLPTRM
jgi:hypothetical protein